MGPCHGYAWPWFSFCFPWVFCAVKPLMQFVPVSEIGVDSLKVLSDKPIIMARDLAPDGKQVALLMTGTKADGPLRR